MTNFTLRATVILPCLLLTLPLPSFALRPLNAGMEENPANQSLREALQGAATAGLEEVGPDRLVEGSRVFHPRFGHGEVKRSAVPDDSGIWRTKILFGTDDKQRLVVAHGLHLYSEGEWHPVISRRPTSISEGSTAAERAAALLGTLRTMPGQSDRQGIYEGVEDRVWDKLSVTLQTEMEWKSAQAGRVVRPFATKLARIVPLNRLDDELLGAIVTQIAKEVRQLQQPPASLTPAMLERVLPKMSSEEVEALFADPGVPLEIRRTVASQAIRAANFSSAELFTHRMAKLHGEIMAWEEIPIKIRRSVARLAMQTKDPVVARTKAQLMLKLHADVMAKSEIPVQVRRSVARKAMLARNSEVASVFAVRMLDVYASVMSDQKIPEDIRGTIGSWTMKFSPETAKVRANQMAAAHTELMAQGKIPKRIRRGIVSQVMGAKDLEGAITKAREKIKLYVDVMANKEIPRKMRRTIANKAMYANDPGASRARVQQMMKLHADMMARTDIPVNIRRTVATKAMRSRDSKTANAIADRMLEIYTVFINYEEVPETIRRRVAVRVTHAKDLDTAKTQARRMVGRWREKQLQAGLEEPEAKDTQRAREEVGRFSARHLETLKFLWRSRRPGEAIAPTDYFEELPVLMRQAGFREGKLWWIPKGPVVPEALQERPRLKVFIQPEWQDAIRAQLKFSENLWLEEVTAPKVKSALLIGDAGFREIVEGQLQPLGQFFLQIRSGSAGQVDAELLAQLLVQRLLQAGRIFHLDLEEFIGEGFQVEEGTAIAA